MRRSQVYALAAHLIVGATFPSFAQDRSPQLFPSAEAASSALAAAVQHHDGTAVMTILGGGPELTHEDDIEDRLLHERFAGKYRQMHRLVRERDGNTVLYIGAENWPFPVPLVLENGVWHFDARAGLMEVLFRRIGENEAMAIEASKVLVAAKQHGGFSAHGDPDDTDMNDSEPASADPTPYHGYYFRVLVPTGQDRACGASFVAYPADYRSSGVMTFMVGPGDAVYEKDLGADTARIAGAMTAESPTASWPDPSWKLVGQDP